MIIDGKDAILGRVATYAAKAALEGEDVVLVNAKEVVIVGDKNVIVGRYRELHEMGTMSKGPFFPRTTSGIVRRSIRGMLKRKSPHGREALRRIKVFEDVPAEYKDKARLEVAKFRSDKPVHRVTIGELSNILKSRPA